MANKKETCPAPSTKSPDDFKLLEPQGYGTKPDDPQLGASNSRNIALFLHSDHSTVLNLRKLLPLWLLLKNGIPKRCLITSYD